MLLSDEQERLKKTNRIVKKAPKEALQHSRSTGDLARTGDAGEDGVITRNDNSPPNLAALLKGFGSRRRKSSRADCAGVHITALCLHYASRNCPSAVLPNSHSPAAKQRLLGKPSSGMAHAIRAAVLMGF